MKYSIFHIVYINYMWNIFYVFYDMLYIKYIINWQSQVLA